MKNLLKEPDFELPGFLHTLPDLYLILSPELLILDATDTYLNATLTEREKIMGQHIFQIFPDNPKTPDANATKNLRYSLEQVLITHKPHIMALQHYDVPKPGGGFEEKYWSPLNTPVLNETGEVKYIIHKVIDVTKQVLTERENEKNMKRADKSEKENEILTKLNNDLDNFIYIASHDLKSPISNIEGLIYALQEVFHEKTSNCLEATKEATDIIGYMSNSVTKFKQTIVELTEIAKVQKATEEDRSIQDCREIIEDVKILLDVIIKESQAMIYIDLSDNPCIYFSKKNLTSIIYNLLSNAIKYRSPKRNLEILIKIGRSNGFTILSVKDNGIGVDIEKKGNKEKMFAMFKRLHSHVEGTGIGLYLVKRMMDNAMGKIEVESKVGFGTTFSLYFKEPA